ncbi:MAG: hypothetical protein QG556_291 [Pseudomonadota bacterium]|nr:hypothetical protein [Pseudomonadota bacterium]
MRWHLLLLTIKTINKMQIKTIKKAIETKVEEWLKSITDAELLKEVEKNLLVSGGCITNMFLGEDVNDYDIYLMDKNVLVKLAEYYCKAFPNIEIMKGWERESLLKEFEKEGVDADFMFAKKIAIDNLKPEQVKLYFDEKNGGIRVNEDKEKAAGLYVPVFFSPNAISLTDKIQIVLRFTGDAKAIHENYDFLHATNYYTTKEGLVLNQKALESILTKQLMYQGSKYPLTSIIRVRKFLKRQWNINAGELLKIMFQISELDLKNPNVLEEQLIGVDVAYFGKLIEILRNAKPEGGLTSGYLNTIIDKVFSESEETL